MPRAIPRWSSGNASVRIAEELAISIAAPTPWNTRITTSHRAAAGPVIQVIESSSEKNGEDGKAQVVDPHPPVHVAQAAEAHHEHAR